MQDVPEYDGDAAQFIRSLDPEKFEVLRAEFTGRPTKDLMIHDMRVREHGEFEACFAIAKLFGIRVLTSTERQERREERATRATLESASAANQWAGAAVRSASAAETANATAANALQVAKGNVWWTAIAGIVAVIALLLSLFGKTNERGNDRRHDNTTTRGAD